LTLSTVEAGRFLHTAPSTLEGTSAFASPWAICKGCAATLLMASSGLKKPYIRATPPISARGLIQAFWTSEPHPKGRGKNKLYGYTIGRGNLRFYMFSGLSFSYVEY